MKYFVLSFNYPGVEIQGDIAIRKGIIAENEEQARLLARKYLNQYDIYISDRDINWINEVTLKEYIRDLSVNDHIEDAPFELPVHTITASVNSGCLDVANIPEGIILEVKDYDVEGFDSYHTDDDGEHYFLTRFTSKGEEKVEPVK